MPKSFKALATIMVWILWICSLVMGFGTFIMGIISKDLFNKSQVPPMVYPALFAVAGFYGILAAVIMIIRKRME
jgi:hypothetical protein